MWAVYRELAVPIPMRQALGGVLSAPSSIFLGEYPTRRRVGRTYGDWEILDKGITMRFADIWVADNLPEWEALLVEKIGKFLSRYRRWDNEVREYYEYLDGFIEEYGDFDTRSSVFSIAQGYDNAGWTSASARAVEDGEEPSLMVYTSTRRIRRPDNNQRTVYRPSNMVGETTRE